MPNVNYHVAVIEDSAKYQDFRRQSDKFGPGVDVTWGVTADGKAELQAIEFDAAKFTEAEAKAWLAAHPEHKAIKFEAATGAHQPPAKAEGLAVVDLQASGGPQASGIAYSGGPMNLPGFKHPVIVAIDGLEIPPAAVPLLAEHKNQVRCRVGSAKASVVNGQVAIDGPITGANPDTQEILAQAAKGQQWQLSIGADVKDHELVPAGQSRFVNGRQFAGPFYHVRRALLREVSIVAVGADPGSQLQIAATWNLNGVHTMDKTPEELKAEAEAQARVEAQRAADLKAAADTAAAQAVETERKRISAIKTLCNGECPEAENKAVADGLSVEAAAPLVLAAVRANRPAASPALAVHTAPAGREGFKRLEAALCLRAGFDEDELVKPYGEKLVEAALADREIGLKEVLLECCRLEGIPTPRTFGNDSIRAAFSTVSLPGLLSNVANKRLLKSFQAQEIVALSLCSEGDLQDFKEAPRYRLNDVGDLVKVDPTGELTHGSLSEDSAANQLDTYGKLLVLSRQMIVNDDLNAFMRIPEGMGAKAGRKIDELFFSRLLSQAGTIFTSGHGNYATGAGTALSGTSLPQAAKMFLDQTDSAGKPIAVNFKYLVTPTDLYYTALVLTMPVNLTVMPNPFMGLEVKKSPYLNNANYAGGSGKAWYLWGDPAVVDTFEIGYLKGRKTPTIEQGQTDMNTLGISFRVYFDVGVREQDFRGMVKMKGEA